MLSLSLERFRATFFIATVFLFDSTTVVEGFAPPVLTQPFLLQSTVTVVAVTPSSSYIESLNSSPPKKRETPKLSLADQEQQLHLLNGALDSNSTAASQLLSEFNQLRENGATQEEMEQYWDDILDAVDGPLDEESSVKLPWWARLRPFARFSQRARLASLQRVLDMSTPSAEETETDNSNSATRRRRRRSLVVLIRALANANNEEQEEGDESAKVTKKGRTPNIAVLEKAARRDLRSSIQTKDMESRLPPGLETPDYKVLARRKEYEIRRYEPFSVCSVPMNTPRPADVSKTDAKISNPQLAGASSFGALAGYLFGKNQQSTAMKMTTPVLSQGEGDSKSMSFVLPSVYWKEDGIQIAPQPLEGSGVQLERNRGGDRAALMFGGFAAKKDVEARKAQLLERLSTDAEWMVENGASVTLAQYNDPFTPPWKRRNEVSINVVRKT